MQIISQWRELISDCIIGISSSALALLVTIGLTSIVGETYVTILIATVALVCWRRGWRAGVGSAVAGLVGVVMLLPPLFSFQVDSADDVVQLVVFALTAFLVCSIALAHDRRSRHFRIVQRRWQDAEQWLSTAQQVTRFWTWEIDLDRNMVKWVDPYGELKSQEYAPLGKMLARLHPGDGDRFRAAVTAASTTGALCLEFRADGPNGERHLLAKGVMADDPNTNSRRLIGVSVELKRNQWNGGEAPELALAGIDDLLASLAQSPNLDRNARLNVSLARDVIGRLMPADQQR